MWHRDEVRSLPMNKSHEDLERDVENLQKALSTFVIWTAQSAASPIRVDEAEKILNLIKPKQAAR